MEIDFEEILVDNLNHANNCLDQVFSYSKISADKVIEAKTIILQTLQMIYLKNCKNNCNNNNDSRALKSDKI